MSAEIVSLVEGEARTTSLVIADGVNAEHKPVIRLIRDNLDDLEEFGRVRFENAPFETAGGVQSREVAVLNEQQTTLLLTYMRNNEIVRAFKKRLVKAFYELSHQSADLALPQNFVEALEALLVREKANLELERANAELTPRATAWDAIASAEGDYSVGEAAKILARAGVPNMGPTRLFQKLAELNWTFRGSEGTWMARADRIDRGYLAHKPQFHYHPRTRDRVVDPPQLRVTLKGIERLRQRLGGTRTVIAAVAS